MKPVRCDHCGRFTRCQYPLCGRVAHEKAASVIICPQCDDGYSTRYFHNWLREKYPVPPPPFTITRRRHDD